MAVDFKHYTVYDLAFFAAYGSLADSNIKAIGDAKEIRRVIKDYVAKKPREFMEEFKRELASNLETKTADDVIRRND
ncbi:MAG: hypothetical protein AABX91_02220 [Nanoarchaeota archaeon]